MVCSKYPRAPGRDPVQAPPGPHFQARTIQQAQRHEQAAKFKIKSRLAPAQAPQPQFTPAALRWTVRAGGCDKRNASGPMDMSAIVNKSMAVLFNIIVIIWTNNICKALIIKPLRN